MTYECQFTYPPGVLLRSSRSQVTNDEFIYQEFNTKEFHV